MKALNEILEAVGGHVYLHAKSVEQFEEMVVRLTREFGKPVSEDDLLDASKVVESFDNHFTVITFSKDDTIHIRVFSPMFRVKKEADALLEKYVQKQKEIAI